MFLLWATLILLHQGYTLVPVVQVQPGESVTLSCAFSETFQSTTWLHWYKQTAGDTLKLLVTQRKTINPKYEPGIASNIKARNDDKFSNLTILETSPQDEGMYHCAHMEWTKSTWTGTYLSMKGNTGHTSSYSVIQKLTVSDPSHPADSETLQCSVLSESKNEACSGELSVFWFRAGSELSNLDIVYTKDKRLHNCENMSTASTKKCSYSFSKNVGSSDTGTFYCAVATCGEILFGNKTKTTADQPQCCIGGVAMITIICLAISMTVNIGFICQRIQRSLCKNFKQTNNESQTYKTTEDGQELNYAPLQFNK